MNQQKYIVYAVLILLVSVGIYFTVQKLAKTKSAKNSTIIIDYDKPMNKLSEFQQKGKELYLNKCIVCHGSFQKTDGPRLSLSGYPSKWPDKNELFSFMRNPAEVIKRNPYARELTKVFGAEMTGFPNLTDEEIQSILDYIEVEQMNGGMLTE